MNLKDSPTLQLLLRPESRPYLGYLAWMIQNCDLSLIDSEPEAPTEVVPEPAPESMQAGQSIAEPGTDYNLIDLWSADPIPTHFPPTHHHLLRRSSALPPPLTPCGSSSASRAPLPLARLEAKSLATPRASRPTPPPRPVSPSALPRPTTPSSPPRSVCPEAPLGSPAAAMDFRDLGCTLTLHPFGTPGLLPSSDLPVGLPHHIVTLVIHPHITASVPQISGSAPVFWVYGIAMVHRPLSSVESSTTHGFTAVDRLPSVVLPVSLDSTLAPPPVCATMVSMANVPRYSLFDQQHQSGPCLAHVTACIRVALAVEMEGLLTAGESSDELIPVLLAGRKQTPDSQAPGLSASVRVNSKEDLNSQVLSPQGTGGQDKDI
ncbi:unnamed protein product [Leuciscus chuanchicus]